MGMYDTITVEYKLPLPEDLKGYVSEIDFQTKSFDNTLSHYKITEKGNLITRKVEGEWVESKSQTKNVFNNFPTFKVKKEWYEPVKTTATIVFYNYITSNNTDYDYYIEYEGEIIKGKLKNVKLTLFEANCNKSRKLKDIEFKNQLRLHHQFVQTNQYKFFVRPYNKAIRHSFNFIHKILDLTKRVCYTIEKYITI